MFLSLCQHDITFRTSSRLFQGGHGVHVESDDRKYSDGVLNKAETFLDVYVDLLPLFNQEEEIWDENVTVSWPRRFEVYQGLDRFNGFFKKSAVCCEGRSSFMSLLIHPEVITLAECRPRDNGAWGDWLDVQLRQGSDFAIGYSYLILKVCISRGFLGVCRTAYFPFFFWSYNNTT